eukprot:GHVQ01018566.1.p1 GENE.GHVQ01018566.1~~GHVQ01018566.1.p1  ORF type:complete len:1342 (+),score=293.16 GHVQ01018566.1:433-4458(+)
MSDTSPPSNTPRHPPLLSRRTLNIPHSPPSKCPPPTLILPTSQQSHSTILSRPPPSSSVARLPSIRADGLPQCAAIYLQQRRNSLSGEVRRPEGKVSVDKATDGGGLGGQQRVMCGRGGGETCIRRNDGWVMRNEDGMCRGRFGGYVGSRGCVRDVVGAEDGRVMKSWRCICECVCNGRGYVRNVGYGVCRLGVWFSRCPYRCLAFKDAVRERDFNSYVTTRAQSTFMALPLLLCVIIFFFAYRQSSLLPLYTSLVQLCLHLIGLCVLTAWGYRSQSVSSMSCHIRRTANNHNHRESRFTTPTHTHTHTDTGTTPKTSRSGLAVRTLLWYPVLLAFTCSMSSQSVLTPQQQQQHMNHKPINPQSHERWGEEEREPNRRVAETGIPLTADCLSAVRYERQREVVIDSARVCDSGRVVGTGKVGGKAYTDRRAEGRGERKRRDGWMVGGDERCDREREGRCEQCWIEGAGYSVVLVDHAQQQLGQQQYAEACGLDERGGQVEQSKVETHMEHLTQGQRHRIDGRGERLIHTQVGANSKVKQQNCSNNNNSNNNNTNNNNNDKKTNDNKNTNNIVWSHRMTVQSSEEIWITILLGGLCLAVVGVYEDVWLWTISTVPITAVSVCPLLSIVNITTFIPSLLASWLNVILQPLIWPSSMVPTGVAVDRIHLGPQQLHHQLCIDWVVWVCVCVACGMICVRLTYERERFERDCFVYLPLAEGFRNLASITATPRSTKADKSSCCAGGTTDDTVHTLQNVNTSDSVCTQRHVHTSDSIVTQEHVHTSADVRTCEGQHTSMSILHSPSDTMSVPPLLLPASVSHSQPPSLPSRPPVSLPIGCLSRSSHPHTTSPLPLPLPNPTAARTPPPPVKAYSCDSLYTSCTSKHTKSPPITNSTSLTRAVTTELPVSSVDDDCHDSAIKCTEARTKLEAVVIELDKLHERYKGNSEVCDVLKRAVAVLGEGAEGMNVVDWSLMEDTGGGKEWSGEEEDGVGVMRGVTGVKNRDQQTDVLAFLRTLNPLPSHTDINKLARQADKQTNKRLMEGTMSFGAVTSLNIDRLGKREDLVGVWNLDVFELNEQSKKHPLTTVVMCCSDRYGMCESFGCMRTTMMKLVGRLESMYSDHPYHNWVHAADVTNSIVFLFDAAGWISHVSPLELSSAIIAAAAHDVGHPGCTNEFLIKTADMLAIRYNDKAVLESYHSATLFELLCLEECNILLDLTQAEKRISRQTMTELILETDMQKHFGSIATVRSHFANRGRETGGVTKWGQTDEQWRDDWECRLLVMKFLMKCADLGHAAKNRDLHVRWSLLVFDEFFIQGDKEKALGLSISPLCDKEAVNVNKSQVYFL